MASGAVNFLSLKAVSGSQTLLICFLIVATETLSFPSSTTNLWPSDIVHLLLNSSQWNLDFLSLTSSPWPSDIVHCFLIMATGTLSFLSSTTSLWPSSIFICFLIVATGTLILLSSMVSQWLSNIAYSLLYSSHWSLESQLNGQPYQTLFIASY